MSTSDREALLAKTPMPEDIDSAEPELVPHPEIPRILVVDDEKVIREILSDFLNIDRKSVV